MSIKVFKVVPPPVPQPPSTYDLTGLTTEQLSWLRDAINLRRRQFKGEFVIGPIRLCSAGNCVTQAIPSGTRCTAHTIVDSPEYSFLRRISALLSVAPTSHVEREK